MEQVKITLKPEEYTALFRLCESELRTPADQIRFVLRRELERRKLLPPDGHKPQPPAVCHA